MRTPIIPEWCKGLPDKTQLYSADILEFFQYSPKSGSAKCAGQYILDGAIPEPNKIKLKLRGSKGNTKNVWLLGDMRKLRAQMINNK